MSGAGIGTRRTQTGRSTEFNELFATTRIVDPTGAQGTDLTIASAVNALPGGGGRIYLVGATHNITGSSIPMPDAPVFIKGCGDAAVVALGAGVFAAFTIPNGLTARRDYVFEDFLVTGTSLAGQKIWSIEDTNSRGVPFARRVNSSGVQIPVHVTASGASEPVTVNLDDCHFIPLADGSSILVNTVANIGATVNAYMQRVRFYDIFQDAVTGALTAGGFFIDFTGVNILGEDCAFSLGTGSTMGALNLTDSVLLNFGPNANPVIAIADDNNGVISSGLTACHGSFVDFNFAGNGTHVEGGIYASCGFTDGAISFFTDVTFFGTLSAHTTVILGSGSTQIEDCNFANSGTSFVLDGNFKSIIGCQFADAPTALIRLTNGTATVVGNTSLSNTVAAVLEVGTSSSFYDDNHWHTASTLLDPSDATVNGVRRATVSGATTDVNVNQFTHVNPKGIVGIGTIKNTGANGMTVRESVTDAFGTSTTLDTPVASGTAFILNPQIAKSTATPPYLSYAVGVRSTIAGTPTTFSIQHATEGEASAF